MLKINEIYNEDCIIGMKKIEKESIDLIIADPPYFKVINQKWDYIWKTEDDYLNWTEEWISEAFNTLRLGGTFYLFGYFRTLAKILPIAEKIGFKLRQQIIIDKGLKSIGGRATKNYKMFPNVTESILFFVKDPIPFTKNFLKKRQKELGIKSKEINEKLGVKSNGGGMWSIYTGENVCEQYPTKENWNKLQEILNFDLQYEKISITFNTIMGYSDVWDDINFYIKDRILPTQKPFELIERLILSSSNKDETVLDPFLGSGTTVISSILNNRKYIGFENNEDYFKKTIERIQKINKKESRIELIQSSLFK